MEPRRAKLLHQTALLLRIQLFCDGWEEDTNSGEDILKPSLISTILPFGEWTNQVGMDNRHGAKFPHRF